jgi:hypothetical protein
VGHHCGRCRRQHQLGHLQSHCCYWRVVHILVKLIVISVVLSSFNNADLFRSMSADCCMHCCRGWGTMAAVGRPSLYLGTSRGRWPPTPQPTNNQPPTNHQSTWLSPSCSCCMVTWCWKVSPIGILLS